MQHGQLAGQLVVPELPQPCPLRAGEQRVLPGHVIAELGRRAGGWQPGAGQVCAVARAELVEQQADRPTIHDDVVCYCEEHVIPRRAREQVDFQDWTPGQVEGVFVSDLNLSLEVLIAPRRGVNLLKAHLFVSLDL